MGDGLPPPLATLSSAPWSVSYPSRGSGDGFGRKVTQQGQRVLPTISAPPPVLTPPRSLGARRSCPYPDTSPSPSTARHESTPADPSRYTAGPGRGGSMPRADACPSLAIARLC